MIDSPLKLELRVTEPPRCTIKPSGTTVSVTASVTIALVPPNQPEVQLSSMIMVRTPEQGMQRVKEGGRYPLLGSNTTLPAFPPRMPDSAPRWPSGGRRCAPSWTCAGGQVSEGLGRARNLSECQCLQDNHTCPAILGSISFSRGSSRPRDRTQVSHIGGRRFNL